MVTSEIKITSLLPTTLDTREGATLLSNVVREETIEDNKLVLDFENVIFMSRSFADQFHKEVTKCDNHIDLVFKNADYGIIEMFEAVTRTQKHRRAIKKNYSVLCFNDIAKLKDYTYAW